MRISLFFFFSALFLSFVSNLCPLFLSPLEIKLRFAAVAVPGRLDQGRAPLHGLSLPPGEAPGTQGMGEARL